MSYAQATFHITHHHGQARRFDSQAEAERMAADLNAGRPENCKPFRIDLCEECKQLHVRRGRNVYVIVEQVRGHHA